MAQLVILAGGNRQRVQELEPLFLTMGKKVVYCGKTGQGSMMKMFINLLLGLMMEGFAEALNFGRLGGLDLEAMLDVVASGAMNAPMFQVKAANFKVTELSAGLSPETPGQGRQVRPGYGLRAGRPGARRPDAAAPLPPGRGPGLGRRGHLRHHAGNGAPEREMMIWGRGQGPTALSLKLPQTPTPNPIWKIKKKVRPWPYFSI